MSSGTQSNAYRGKTLVLTGLILLISITGCAKRQLIRTTPQMDAEQKFWIRVLLLKKQVLIIAKDIRVSNLVSPDFAEIVQVQSEPF